MGNWGLITNTYEACPSDAEHIPTRSKKGLVSWWKLPNAQSIYHHSTAEVTEEKQITVNPCLSKWRQLDRLLRGWITGTLTEEVLGFVVGHYASHEIWKWNTLVDSFFPNDHKNMTPFNTKVARRLENKLMAFCLLPEFTFQQSFLFFFWNRFLL